MIVSRVRCGSSICVRGGGVGGSAREILPTSRSGVAATRKIGALWGLDLHLQVHRQSNRILPHMYLRSLYSAKFMCINMVERILLTIVEQWVLSHDPALNNVSYRNCE